MRFRKIAIIGVGLLGGSLGLAVQKRRLAREVVGYVRRAASVTEARRLRTVGVATRDLRNAVEGADLIILCTPLGQMRPIVLRMAPALKRGAVVTDVGSVKSSAARDLEGAVARAGAHFIGSHPMAGSEKTGMAAARADLFEDAVCVVTPTRASNRDALRRVELFWRAVGARTVRMNPRHHDVLVGRSSHLPHLAAVTLANLVLRPGRPPAQADLCANGFRDTTRIASGSPEMWRDIMMANRGPLRRALDDYIGELRKLRQALKTADEKAVARHLDLAKRRRDDWRARSGSASSE